jgi:hypothetical protein
MGFIRDYSHKNSLIELYKREVMMAIRPQIIMFYLNTIGKFRDYQDNVSINRSKEIYDQLAFQAYHIYFDISKDEETEKHRNLHRENELDSILYPTYFMLLPSLFKAIIP